MKKLHTVLALVVFSTSLMGGVAIAQDQAHQDNQTNVEHRDNHSYVEHKEWRKGSHIKHEDWDRGEKIDYRQNHLSAPPRGYEWRMVDGNYVLRTARHFRSTP